MNSSKTLHSSKDWIRRTAGVDLDKTDVEFIEILGPLHTYPDILYLQIFLCGFKTFRVHTQHI